jgi:hypothetical protein
MSKSTIGKLLLCTFLGFTITFYFFKKDQDIILNFDSLVPSFSELKLIGHELIDWDTQSGIDGSNCIKVHYIGNDHGSERVLSNISLPNPMYEATLKFAIKFDEGFDFAKGGKIHGLGPDNPIQGGNKGTPGGWSLRMLFEENGFLSSYLYHQKNSGKYGDCIKTDSIIFTPGKYHHVDLYMKLNNPASEKNGVFEIWVDEKKRISGSGIQFRSVEGDSTLINNFLFSTFHGGNSPVYAPKDTLGKYSTEVAWFDEIEIIPVKTTRE